MNKPKAKRLGRLPMPSEFKILAGKNVVKMLEKGDEKTAMWLLDKVVRNAASHIAAGSLEHDLKEIETLVLTKIKNLDVDIDENLIPSDEALSNMNNDDFYAFYKKMIKFDG